jgi:hypothetical protein
LLAKRLSGGECGRWKTTLESRNLPAIGRLK